MEGNTHQVNIEESIASTEQNIEESAVEKLRKLIPDNNFDTKLENSARAANKNKDDYAADLLNQLSSPEPGGRTACKDSKTPGCAQRWILPPNETCDDLPLGKCCRDYLQWGVGPDRIPRGHTYRTAIRPDNLYKCRNSEWWFGCTTDTEEKCTTPKSRNWTCDAVGNAPGKKSPERGDWCKSGVAGCFCKVTPEATPTPTPAVENSGENEDIDS